MEMFYIALAFIGALCYCIGEAVKFFTNASDEDEGSGKELFIIGHIAMGVALIVAIISKL